MLRILKSWQQVSKHYARILSQWPADRLRPEVAFQNILKKRVDAAPVPQAAQENTAQAIPRTVRTDAAAEMKEVNALYSLLENRYSKAVCCAKPFGHDSSTMATDRDVCVVCSVRFAHATPLESGSLQESRAGT